MPIVRIPLGDDKFAVVDAADEARVKRFRWRSLVVGNRTYAVCGGGGPSRSQEYLHRLILNAPDGLDVDHINHDGLDCRRSNLRLATRTQNNANRGRLRNNTSGYKGVTRHYDGRWRAKLTVNGKTLHLGCFATPEEAAHAYDRAAIRYFGEFALTNFTLD